MQNPDLVSLWTWDERGFATPALDREDHLKQGLTVAVCTYKRAHSLGMFLASLAAQECCVEHYFIRRWLPPMLKIFEKVGSGKIC